MAQASAERTHETAHQPQRNERSWLRRHMWVIAGLIAAAAVVIFLAPAASSDPDGLDRVAQDKEFAEKAEDPWYEIFPDYTIPGIDNEWATVVAAGLIGVAIVFVLPMAIGFVLRLSRRTGS